jgi:crotonobetainyl-CoA:carnitine CoA-transferase CaiB-like acyl-CoA transferase
MLSLLKSIKVVDFTTVVLGPYATQFLADFGADVIKVEPLEGDGFRSVRPGPSPDVGAGFANFNRNKRSIALDLKKPSGQEVMAKLVSQADVVVHNMRSLSASALGISYHQLKQIKPDLVYCWSPGFASAGPDAESPAYDDVIQARSGMAALNADESGAPQFFPSVVCDKVVGLHLAMAITSALVHKLHTGEGQSIEVPMLETMTSFLLAEHLAGHTMVPSQGDMGYQRLVSPNRRPFQTKDGYMAIMPYTTKHWIRFLLLVGEDELAQSEWVNDTGARSDRIDELYELIARVAPMKTNDAWVADLGAQDVPCALVNSLTDVFEDPQLSASQVLQWMPDQGLGPMRYLRPGFFANPESSGSPRRAPRLGEHSAEILAELGFSQMEIDAATKDGVITSFSG